MLEFFFHKYTELANLISIILYICMIMTGGKNDKQDKKHYVRKYVEKEKKAYIERKKNMHVESQKIESLKTKTDEKALCQDIIVMPQVTGTCWFNSLIACMFYSDSMRRLLLHLERTVWNKRDNNPVTEMLFTLFRDLLANNYRFEDVKSANKQLGFNGTELLRILKPETLLMTLHAYDPDNFDFNPHEKQGWTSVAYVSSLMEFMRVDFAMLDAVENGDGYLLFENIDHDFVRKGYVWPDQEETNFKLAKKAITRRQDLVTKRREFKSLRNKDVLVIRRENVISSNVIAVMDDFKLNRKIVIDGTGYVLDSVSMTNREATRRRGHTISGITCRGKYYIYNGWPKSPSNRNVKNSESGVVTACPLMLMNWMKNRSPDRVFCLKKTNRDACTSLTFDTLKRYEKKVDEDQNTLCFSFNANQNIYFYVNEKYRKGPLDYKTSASDSFFMDDGADEEAEVNAENAAKTARFIETLLKNGYDSKQGKADMFITFPPEQSG